MTSNTDNRDPYDLPQQEADKAKADKQKELEAYNRAEDLKWLMKSKNGRRFIWHLLGRTGLRKEPMTGNSWTYYNLGALAVGRELEAELNIHCHENYMLMITENS